jgi:hypothetical protein
MIPLRVVSYARSEILLLFNLSSQRLGFSAEILYMERVVGENDTESEFYKVLRSSSANHHFDNDLYLRSPLLMSA